jgi:RNA polymerase sigma factor (sigma-70 family)
VHDDVNDDVGDGGDSDAALARRAAQGDERAFTALMRRHKEAVYRVARRHLGDADEAYDVVQDVFVSAWRNIDRYDPERPLPTWLFRIAVNACRDRHRRRAVRSFFFRAAPIEGPASAKVVDETERVEDRAVDRDQLRRVEAAIAELPEGAREAFLLCVVEGLPQKEAADVLGVTVKAVETRVARARRLLSEQLDDEG